MLQLYFSTIKKTIKASQITSLNLFLSQFELNYRLLDINAQSDIKIYRNYLKMERKLIEKSSIGNLICFKQPHNLNLSVKTIKQSQNRLPSAHESRLKTITNNNTFKVNTNTLVFYGKERQEEIITIQNIGRDLIKINVTVPKTIYFKIRQEQRNFTLSAGMTKKVTIQFIKYPIDNNCLDYVFVQTDKQSQKLHLNWYQSKPAIQYQTLLNFQRIQTGKTHYLSAEFKNISNLQTKKINLIKDPMESIQIHPQKFTLKPLQSNTIQIVISPQAEGVYHHKIIVQQEGNLLPPMEIIYSAVNSIYRIQDTQGKQVKQLDFGTLIKGIKKQQILWARNTGPREVELKIKIKIGKSLRTQSSLQSPQQLGIESSSTVIQTIHKTIKISPFSKSKIPLVAFLGIQQKEHQIVERLAKSETLVNSLLKILQKQDSFHHQVLVCEFIDSSKPNSLAPSKPITSIVPMRVTFSLPVIKITPSSLNLGTIFAGTSFKTSLDIDNLSSSTSFSLQVGKLLNSECFLFDDLFLQKQSGTIDIITKGGNLGSFKNTLNLTVSSLFNIKIPIEYEVVSQSSSLLSRQNKLIYTSHGGRTNSQFNFNNTLEIVEKEKNKQKYRVPVFRRLQVKNNSSSSLFNPPETTNSIRNSTSLKNKQNKYYESHLDDSLINQRRSPSCHKKKYPLFVTRKIDKYQPFVEQRETKKLQKTKNCKDYFGQVHRNPKNRKQAEEIERQLTAQQLKMIIIGEKVVSFGRLFIKSSAQNEWTIINQTNSAIIVQLKDNNLDTKRSAMLSQTDFEPQIIPAQAAGMFKIAFQASTCGKFQTTLPYTINKIHTFQLLVTAEVELVALLPSKNQLKMGYEDEHDLLLSQVFSLKNEGNTSAIFCISQVNQRFIITPTEGKVPAGKELQIKVIENDQDFPVIQAGQMFGSKGVKNGAGVTLFEQRILIKINDGDDISLKAFSQPGLADPRCLVRQSRLNFGCTIVSKEKTKTFQIKNLTRTLSQFQIICDECSDFLTFDCMKGKIPAEGTKQISTIYKSSIIHNISSFFKIQIKGGLIINVPINAESIAPEISILEEGFSFGEVCCDTATIKTINIKNNSQIPVQLLLDTTGRDKGIQFLMPSFWGATSQPIKDHFVPKKLANQTSFGKGAAMEEEILDNAIQEPNIHKLKVEPKSIYSFNFVFKPTVPGYFEFIFPIYLEGYIRNEAITKIVSCNVIEPRFIVEPALVRFKTKIINDKDNGCFHPFVEYLTLRNPTDRNLRWKLDMGGGRKACTSITSHGSKMSVFNRSIMKDALTQKSCFEIDEKKGELKPKQSVSINISFNPIEEGFYYHKVPLYIFSQIKSIYQQESQVRLEGEGKYPTLYFNRKQLILPIVPLGIESIGMFQVFNDGYETINLKHRFQISDSQGNIHTSRGNLTGQNGLPQLYLFFPQENKLTLSKKQIIIMVKFISKKATSFTCKLQLYDDTIDCRVYSLSISATSDNSLLTTFTYLSNPQNIYKLQNIQLDQDKRKKTQQTTTVWLKSNDGRHLIDRYHDFYDGLTPQSFLLSSRIVKRWINNFFREEKVRNFPIDLAQNSELLLKFLFKLTNRKQFDGTHEIELEDGSRQILNGHSCSNNIFYEIVIRLLKQLGCLLSHIRPQFLLESGEFMLIMSRESNWKSYCSYYQKNFEVLHRQAWLILFFQLHSHFWCQRQRSEPLVSKPHSNVYSNIELTVLRWVKNCYESVLEFEDAKNKFTSFGRDYKDCIAPIHCLLRYCPPSRRQKVLEEINKRPITSAQLSSNTKILYELLQILNVVPLIYEQEYQQCTDKQIFLFIHQLYELLPQMLPKGDPLIFTCQLGSSISRTIQIKNPSNKTVHYWVKIQGSKDFQAEEKESISIEPKGVFNFLVDFKGRLSVQQTAFLSFFSKQNGETNSINGTAMVFQLISRITGRKSIKKIDQINCALYQSTCVKVVVDNIFEDFQLANFRLDIIEQNMENVHHFRKTTQNSQELITFDQKRQIKQFYCQSEMIKIKKGLSGSIQLCFTPIRMGKTKCFMIFHDPLVGQFQYEITGEVQMPRTLQEIRVPQPVIVGRRQKIELSLPMYNSFMLKSQTLIEQLNSEKIASGNKNDELFKLDLNMDPKITQFITFPKDYLMKGIKKDSSENNKIKIQCFFPSVIKDLVLDFILIGSPKRQIQDVRRFKVAINIQHPPLTQQFFMTTTARKSLMQPFPLDNTSHKDWKLRISMVENECRYFSLKQGEICLQRELIVRKGHSQSLNIYFDPKWVGQTSTKVNIHNATTNEQVILLIKGISEEPLSEDHVHIRTGNEDSTLYTLNITNPYPEKCLYSVLSDLQELQIPPSISLEPHQTIPFYIFARSLGNLSQVGYLKFIDDLNRFFWYSIAVESSQKKVRDFSVEMQGEVGSQIEKQVQFKNPFSKPLEYKVQYPKGLGLEAKQEFTIVPNGVYSYRIKYRPERATEQEVILKAVNNQIGIFLYKIKLKAKDEKRKKVIQLSAQVGKSGYYDIKIDNPRKQDVNIHYSLTNSQFFTIDGPQLLHPGQNIGKIKFTPITEGKQICTLRVWSQNFATRCFQLEGVGLAPYSIECIQFKTRPLDSHLEVIRFFNPNPKHHYESVKVCLTENNHGSFKIVGHQNEGNWITEVSDLLPVPVEFSPKTKGYFQSVLTIQCFHYQWKYVLKGSTNFHQVQIIHEQIKTVNKQQAIKRFKIPIPEYYDQTSSFFDKITIDHSDTNLLRQLKTWLKLKLNPPCQDQQDEKCITITSKFKPKKQLKEVIHLVLSSSKEEGPTLTYNMQLTATEAKADSTISLEVTAIKNISFQLNGLGDQATIGAKMLRGNHCYAQKSGNSVKILFKPTHLLFTKSRYYTDYLLVENNNEQWNYEIKFVLKN